MTALKNVDRQPLAGILSVLTVFCGLALGHTTVVLQWEMTGGISVLDTVVSMSIGSLGLVLVWIGLKRPENQATILGYVGGLLIWVGFFEWTWHYFGHWLNLEPVMDGDIPILMPGLLMIQATSLIVITMLIFLGANKDTRCRMFMWFHRNFKLRPGRMTPGYKRQHARTTAIETVFLIWFIYLCAIMINDPRLIKYDSVAAMVITVGFLAWGVYLFRKALKIRGLGATFRYAIPTANILWLPIEAFSRWGLYPEVWVKPLEYSLIMLLVLALFVLAGVAVFRTPQPGAAAAPA
ncbi:MAG: hypothetical protein JSV45_08830 [Chromatiales bacterium]|nr:MAG: hypothetical protein JSV45_08830 [Chromatiales bacterium]